jgi:D-threo-aldose 1-dehydrogenase
MTLAIDQFRPFGKSGLNVPPVVFRSSALGNAIQNIPDQTKRRIVCEWFRHVEPPLLISSSGGCSTGAELEVLARSLDRLEMSPDEVIICTELDWTGATSPSCDRVVESWAESCRVQGQYVPKLAAIGSLDEYLAAAPLPAERDRRFSDILDSYRALGELKATGQLIGIGACAKDWRIVREIDAVVTLDWVMLVGSYTVMNHTVPVLDFIAGLGKRKIPVINSGVFHAGFLVGGQFLDNRLVSLDNAADQRLFAWRKAFVALCQGHGVSPAHACIQFGLSTPGIVAVALTTSRPERIAENVEFVLRKVPESFWTSMKEERLLAEDFPYLG